MQDRTDYPFDQSVANAPVASGYINSSRQLSGPKSVPAYNTHVGLGGYGGGWDPGEDFNWDTYGRNSFIGNYTDKGIHWKPEKGNKYGGGGGGGKAGINGTHYFDETKGSQAGAPGAHGVVVIIQEE